MSLIITSYDFVEEYLQFLVLAQLLNSSLITFKYGNKVL
jgi:hypothetical protein